jgi:hypothetical protein
LRRILQRIEVLLCTRQKKTSSSKQSVVCADPFPPTPSTSSATKTQKTHKGTPDNPETADEGNIPVEYSSN